MAEQKPTADSEKQCFSPGLAGIPVVESAVSSIDGTRGYLEYRGIDIEELAERSSFEETAWLLLYGDLPKKEELAGFDNDLRHQAQFRSAYNKN